MAVDVLCPKCQAVSSLDIPIPRKCSKCGAEFPDLLVASAEKTVLSQMPGLIRVGQWLSIIFAVIMVAMLITAPFNIGDFLVNGEKLTGHEFLRVAGIPVALQTAILVSILIGLWRRQAWSRPLMLIFWLVICVIAGIQGYEPRSSFKDGMIALLIMSPFAIIATLYLYCGSKPARYFKAMKRKAG